MDKFEGHITAVYDNSFFVEVYRTNKNHSKSDFMSEAEIPVSFLTDCQKKEFLEEGHILKIWSENNKIKKIVFKRDKPFTVNQLNEANKLGAKLKKSLNWE
jgi:hypothetical protein